jgi:hydroxymethylbilane synthase
MRPLRIGTRGSQLALWQARTVASMLEQQGYDDELVIIKTAGDRLQEAPLSEIGGKRLFVKEIEDALLNGEIDLAVHSAKDLPAMLPDGLELAAVLRREDPRDALVLPGGGDPMDLAIAAARSGDSVWGSGGEFPRQSRQPIACRHPARGSSPWRSAATIK